MKILKSAPPPREELLIAHRLRKQLAKLKDCIEEMPPKNVRIKGIITNTTCAHGCRHCGVSCGEYSEDWAIRLSVVEEARKSGLLRRDAVLSGGEPLDHPEIVELAGRFGGNIDVTNGFSGSTGKISGRRRILEGLDDAITRTGISLHALDRWEGRNSGRDEVLSYLSGNGYMPTVRVITEGGKEKEAARALFWAIGSMLEDKKVRERARESVSPESVPFVRLEGNSVSIVSKFGRGRRLDGLLTENLSLQSDIVNLLLEERLEEVRRKLGGTFLMPDGRLVSAFMLLDYFSAVDVGSIGDSPERLRANLREALLDFTRCKLGRSVERSREEIRESFRNADRISESRIAFWQAFRHDKGAHDAIMEVEASLSRCGVKWDANATVTRHVYLEYGAAARRIPEHMAFLDGL